MPHLIVEYSANVEEKIALDELLDKLHVSAVDSGMFPLGGIRIRAYPARDPFRVWTALTDGVKAMSLMTGLMI